MFRKKTNVVTLTIWLALCSTLFHSEIAYAGSLLDSKIFAVKAGGSSKRNKALTIDSISQNLIKMEYAVRGAVVDAADKISEEIRSGKSEAYPFDKIIYTNIGNPQAVGQKALTWPRQVLALCDLPDECGIDHPQAHLLFPQDVIRRAREIKTNLGVAGTGAYSHSKGARCFRDDIAAFLKVRDAGVEADPESIFLTNGASNGIGLVLQALIADDKCGVMVPIPQYPFYSASITLLGGHIVGYYLEESKGWDLNIKTLEETYLKAQKDGISVKGLVLINPGNPTGQVLSKNAIKDICRFCAKHNIVLLADEVYQQNIYQEGAEFVSCKLAAKEAGLLDNDSIELVSFHSTSKGLFGECGRRGGYMEMVGIDSQVSDQIYKLASASLCSSLSGQVMTSLMVRGPEPGDESYESHEKEKSLIFESLKHRAHIVSQSLNSIPGFSCQAAQGAMYCFPQIELPAGAIKAAARQNLSPDTMYALDLLEHTGICVVPASGFGQKNGRFGFRTTFLAPEKDMELAMESMKNHYSKFCEKYQ